MAFIVFEGIDGSGKSSLLEVVARTLRLHKTCVQVTKEPGGTELGEQLRELLIKVDKNPIQPEAEILLYFADRSQHIHEVIKPALKNNNLLISDRYWASTFAYQCGGRGINETFLSQLHQAVCPKECEPDLWVLLDLPVEVSLARMKQTRRHSRDRFELEDKQFHQQVRDYYLKLSKGKDSWLVLDATKKPEQLLEEVLKVLKQKQLVKI